jgi:hypothetical protein
MSLVDEHLAQREENRRTRVPGVVYVTDIVKPCQRGAYYAAVLNKAASPESLRIFEAGNLIEDWWVNTVLSGRKDLHVIATQLPARYIDEASAVEIHGRVDALVQHGDRALVVHEVKSQRTAAWLREPKPEHVEQLQFYLASLGLDWGQVDYLDKTILLQGRDVKARPGEGGAVDKSFPIQRDTRVFAELVHRGRLLAEAIRAGKSPAKAECWMCQGYCDYSAECRAEDGEGPLNAGLSVVEETSP